MMLPEELIGMIYTFLNNRDSTAFHKTCKYIRNIGDSYGYLSDIYVNRLSRQVKKWIPHFHLHSQSANSIRFREWVDPHLWMGDWTPKVSFHNCVFLSRINPSLTLTTFLSITTCSAINIDWTRFPNLKILNVDAGDISLENIDRLKQLENVNIFLSDDRKDLTFVESLPNLRKLVTNCSFTSPLMLQTSRLETLVAKHSGISYKKLK